MVLTSIQDGLSAVSYTHHFITQPENKILLYGNNALKTITQYLILNSNNAFVGGTICSNIYLMRV